MGEGLRGRGHGERHRRPGLPPLPLDKDNRQALQAEGPAGRVAEGGVAGTGVFTLVRMVGPSWRRWRGRLAESVNNRLTLTQGGLRRAAARREESRGLRVHAAGAGVLR